MNRPIFIDIDGTLTEDSHHGWGEPILFRLAKVRELVAQGCEVIVWSGGGTKYAKAFCEAHQLSVTLATGKPGIIVDDNPKIRPQLVCVSPEEYFEGKCVFVGSPALPVRNKRKRRA